MSARRLHAVIGHAEKSLFDLLQVPGLETHRLGEGDPPDPDLIVLPCSRPGLEVLSSSSALPDSWWRRAAEGRARVVFDASGEGLVHKPETTAALHGFLDQRGVPTGAAAYVTQNRSYRSDYLAHLGASGGGAPMQVLTYDYWIRRFFSWDRAEGERELELRRARFASRPRARARRFLSLNLTARPTRVLFLLRLLKDGLWDQGWVSFGGFEHLLRNRSFGMDRFVRTMRRLNGFGDLAEDLLPLLPDLQARGQVLFGQLKRDPDAGHVVQKPADGAALEEHESSWFTVVSETEMSARARQRITEKPFRALVNFHPLIVLGNPGALEMLREFGFETFGDLIDEGYDEELDPRRRFDLAYAQVRRLCAAPESELADMEARASERLERNARWGLVGLPGRYRDETDPQLVDTLAPRAPG